MENKSCDEAYIAGFENWENSHRLRKSNDAVLEVGKSKERFPPQKPRESMALLTPWFQTQWNPLWTSDLTLYRKYLCCFKSPSTKFVIICYGSNSRLIHFLFLYSSHVTNISILLLLSKNLQTDWRDNTYIYLWLNTKEGQIF